MPELCARMTGVLSVIPDIQSKSLQVRFRDASGQTYLLEFPQAILGTLLMTMITQSQHIAPDPNASTGAAQPMNLNSGRLFVLDDGRSGLELTIENSLRLPLVFPKETIPVLRKALAELERHASPSQKDTIN